MIKDEIEEILGVVRTELYAATAKFGPFNSAHEGYGILKEEVDELWDDVKANDIDHAKLEAVQVAAMAVRFIMDV